MQSFDDVYLSRWLVRTSSGGCHGPETMTLENPPTPTNHRIAIQLLVVITLATGLLVTPAAAQADNPVCEEEAGTLADAIEGFIQVTTALGLMGLLVVWQADSLMEMFTMSREQKASLKQHKRTALKSAGILVLLGPLFTVAGGAMNLPIADCVDLIPF